MTLPLIYALQTASDKDRKYFLKLIKRHNKKPHKVKEIVDFVVSKGGIDYAKDKMVEYKDKALAILNEFPDNESNESLRELVNYTTVRKK